MEWASVDNISDPIYRGALSLKGCSPTIAHLTIREAYNTGIFCYNGASPVMTDVTIENVGMMGIYCLLNSHPTITRAIIHDIGGYGMKIERNCHPVISNALIYNNDVSGIVVEELSHPSIVNVTVYGIHSRGIGLSNSCNPTIKNSIFAEYGLIGLEAITSSRPFLTYSDFYTEDPTIIVFSGFTNFNTETLLFDPPLFEDVSQGDFRLQIGSPCIDAGDPNPVYNDNDGTPNDLGAYGGPNSW